MNTRRDFIRTTVVGATAATVLPRLLQATSPATSPTTGSATGTDSVTRRVPTDRHRNLFNGDTCTYFYNPEIWLPEGGPYSAKVIHRYVDMLAGNGVDTFLINANASKAWYPSKVIPTILDGYRRGDREFFRAHAICVGITKPAEVEVFMDKQVVFYNHYLDLTDAGVDWLAETSVACRQRGVTPWVSIRMNDLHGHRNFQGSFFNLPLLKLKEMRLHHSTYPGMAGDLTYREGLNYALKEVRDLMFAQIREVVEDYDFDGLEIDWWRQPLCCDPTVSPQTLAMMTDWFREIRAMTERRAAKNGRPFYLGMRIPGRLETLKSIGIDVATLCQEGSLDFICPSAFWRTAWDMPHDELRRQVGDRTAIYGVIEEGANAMRTWSPAENLTKEIRYISSSSEMLRANAAGKLALGADGIEWFNFYVGDQAKVPGITSNYSLLREMHRLEFLRGKEKHYTFADRSFAGLSQPPFEAPPQLPVILQKNWRQSFRLPMCAEPIDRDLRLVVQVVLKQDAPMVSVPVSVNACWPTADSTPNARLLFPCGSLTHHVKENLGHDYTFPISLLREGWNEITVENTDDEPLVVVGVELAVIAATPTKTGAA